MPDVLVRNIEDSILEKLKDRANQNGRSLQKELKILFRSIVEENETKILSDEETAAKIKKSLIGGNFSDSTEMIRENRQNR